MLRTSPQCTTNLKASHLPAVFRLLQVHAHWGASDECGTEHSIDHERYSCEVHFVFWNTMYKLEETSKHSDGMAVVAVFLKEGKYNSDYANIADVIGEAVKNDSPVPIPSNFDVSALLPTDSDYFYYEGSLTTPPYNECVIWTVMAEPVEISSSQVSRWNSMI
ncbi:unnamed protein product [Nippostrongylus brasiliensis]|uniref:Putative carbonic anhydrase II (inferred by orthology to a S. mansoni protein) n=1 Tax=Nippostrongylus brasiliensis TaxID=27835 RepID=A0A0N4YHM5_NIPBR|nr:unnamed protein product [Nippostrongylus brasiliensis]